MSDRSTFGKYVLLRKLATGGMGEVFLAKQCGPSGFEKLLVIKRILAQHHDKHEYLNMFLSEARLVAYLTHSNIIQIHEMGQIDGDYFIAMEYVRGKSLRDIIDALRSTGRSLPLPYVIDLAIKLCDGLGYAHEARDIRGRPMNIIHRDINPHNILISYSGDLKLIDFGIAKSEMTSVHTATGTIKGKFVYMSPEQSAADPIDRRSDIFSLGIVVYEMVTGENPFVRQNVVLSLEAIQRHPVPPPSSKRPDCAPLDAVLEKALEKKPENRFQNAYEMRDELRNLLRSGAVKPPETDLNGFLSDLFAADIDEEDRLLAEADRATSPIAIVPGQPATIGSPAVPANLPSVPVLSARPASSPIGDHDTKADRPLGKQRTPQPIEAQPFADDEPTLGEDLEGLAARSRAQSIFSRSNIPPPPEPTGQVLTLIPPEDVAPGTSEEYGEPPLGPEPSTKRDRVPVAAGSFVQPPQDTGNMRAPSQQISAPPPPPPISLPPPPPNSQAMAAFMEPLSPAPPSLTPMPALAFDRRDPSQVNGLSKISSQTPVDPPPSYEPPADLDLSGSLPIYTGISRRSTLIAGALVFLMAAVAGFWGVRSLMAFIQEESAEQAQMDPIPPAAPVTPSVAAEPAEDPRVPPPEPPKPVIADQVPVKADATPIARDEEDDDEPKARKDRKSKKERREERREREAETRAKREAEEAKREEAARVKREAEEAKREEAARKKAEADEAARLKREEEAKKAEEKKRVVTPPAEEEPVAREEKPAPPKEEKKQENTAPAKGRLGMIVLDSSSEVQVEHEGRSVGSAPTNLLIKAESGTINLSGGDLKYVVKLSYKVEADGVAVKIDASPWAIVKHNAISLGKTPQGPISGKRHRISLLRPGQEQPFVVSLIWNPSR